MSELAKALVEAQKEMPAVPKAATAEVPTRNGGKYSYSYATLDSLISKTLPVLNKHGLAIIQSPVALDGGGIGLSTVLAHESGEQREWTMPLPAPGHTMQELGSAITYARRYSWGAILGIASEHDDDAATVSAPTQSAQPKTVAAPSATRSSEVAAAPDSTPTPRGSADGQGKQPAATASQFTPPAQVAEEIAAKEQERAERPVPGDGGEPGAVLIPFGKHKGKRIREVPAAYLEWWLGQEANPKYKRERVAAEIFLGRTEQALPTSEFSDVDVPF